MWPFKPKRAMDEPKPVEQEDTARAPRRSALSTHDTSGRARKWTITERLNEFGKLRPSASPRIAADGTVSAMDADDLAQDRSMAKGYTRGQPDIPNDLAMWYASQSFIGHQLAALVAQHWLVMKACKLPAEDATRNGFTITNMDGDELPDDLLKKLKQADKSMGLRRNMVEFLKFGRVFGIRICIFKVDYGSDEKNAEAYAAPFNIDGVPKDGYKGMVQVDPYWCMPELDEDAVSKPDTPHFYEPTYWVIQGRRYHRSHLQIFRNGDLADFLKPAYQYGGVPVPQLIMERVYGAERTANEAPLLALSKRTVVMKTDIAKAMSNWPKFMSRIQEFADLWTNHGMRVIDKEADDHEQYDTALGDLDSIIMTQYQLVAAAAGVIATKLLETSPKGFNATGEYEESSYHESLETLQSHNLTPFVERHHALVIKSNGLEAVSTSVSWEPLDSPTAKEWAEINKLEAEGDAVLVGTGAIDGMDVRQRIAANRNGPYAGVAVQKAVMADDLPAAAVPTDAR